MTLAALATSWRGLYAEPKTDQIVLYRGDIITGSIKGLQYGRLDYKTDDMDRVSVKWSRVARIKSKHRFEIELTNAKKYVGHIENGDKDGEMVIVTESQRVYLNMPSVVSITPLGTNFWSRLTGSLSLGLDITQTNNQVILNTSNKITYRRIDWKIVLSGSSYLNRQTNVPSSTRNGYTISSQRFFKASPWTALGLLGAEQNDELSLDHRYTAALGTGVFFINTNLTAFQGLAGLATTNEMYTGEPTSDQTLEGFIGLAFDFFRYTDPELQVSADLSTYIGISDWGRLRPQFNASVTWKAFKDFTLGLTAYLQGDTNPAEGAKGLDYSLSTTFGYSWD